MKRSLTNLNMTLDDFIQKEEPKIIFSGRDFEIMRLARIDMENEKEGHY